MDVWCGLENYPTSTPACSVAIGRFDGVHRGHQALISAAVRDARTHRRPCVVFTFDRHPAELFAPERAPEYLTSLEQKSHHIEALGPDHLLIARFDERFRDLSPEAFLHFVVSGMLRARAVFVGQDFRFGFEHAGDVDYLRSGESRFEYRTEIVPAVMVSGEKASSSRIRDLLSEGDLAKAEEMLGHPYVISGRVVKGLQLGRTLGYPTANIDVADRQLIPRDGIYAGWLEFEGQRMAAACSIGVRPTIGGTARTVEAFLLDFSGDMYDKPVTLKFEARLRDEEKFESLEALVKQIEQDVAEVRRLTKSA